MNGKSIERGQSIVLLMLVVVGILAFAALSVDGGIIYSQRRQSQIAADSAAFTAALAIAEDLDYVAAARSQAAANGIIHNGSDPNVEVFRPPVDGEYAGNNQYIQVRITSSVNPVFSHTIFNGSLVNTTEAVVRVVKGTDGPLFGGNAIVALSTDASPAIKVNGSAEVLVTNGGVFSNSSASGTRGNNSSVWINISQDCSDMDGTNHKYFCVEEGINVVSGAGVKNDSSTPVNYDNEQIVVTEETFSFIPAIPETPTCSSAGSSTTSGGVTTYLPGYFNSNINFSGTAVFTPGVYCFNRTTTFTGVVTGQPGTVIFALDSSDFALKANATFDDFEIYSDSAEFKVYAGYSLTANRFRFYGYGSADLTVGGSHASIESGNAFLYFAEGDFVWDGNAELNLTAPPDGDPYEGLLVYMPLTHPQSTYHMNGNTDTYLSGTWLAPTMDLISNGNSDMLAYHSQFIVNTVDFIGNTTFLVDYNAAENVFNSEATKIELVK